MAADEHLSPSQFGFKEGTPEDWNSALEQYDGDRSRRGRIDPNVELHTGQRSMSQEMVDHYVSMRRMDAGHSVEIYHHGGKSWVGDGHHRIAAARAKGQKTLGVIHYG